MRAIIERNGFTRIEVCFALIVSLAIFLAKIFQHLNYGTNAFDFSVYDSAIKNTLDGQFLYSDQLQKNFLAEHFSPILLIFVPLYTVFDSANWLFLAQATTIFFFCLTLIKLSKLAPVQAVGLWPAIITLPLIFYKKVSEGLIYDFHPEVFSLMFVGLALLELKKKRPFIAVLVMLASLTVKEDLMLVLAGLGILMVLERKTILIGSLVIIGSSLLFILVTFLIIPRFAGNSHAENRFLIERWGYYGTDFWSIIEGLIASPIRVFAAIMSGYCSLLGPLLFVPLLSPITLLAALPYITLHATSNLEAEYLFKLHYAFPVIPIILLAYIESVGRIFKFWSAKQLQQKYLRPSICLVGIVILTTGFKYRFNLNKKANTARAEAISLIPKTATVCAQSPFIPHLRENKITYMFPNQGDKMFENADYILVDSSLPPWPMSRSDFDSLLSKLKKERKILWSSGTAILFTSHLN